MDAHPQTSRSGAWADALAAAALLAGVAARIAGAWAARALAEPDPTVVALMARHLAALQEFPIFFYGQAYMGSLEPLGSALMVRLLGSTGFAVALGPALFAAAALFFLWRWARDAAGPWGGLAAALAGLFGPLAYFQFQTAPRGGYMVALLVDALALFAAARLAARLRAGERIGSGRWFALGLLAGVGLWSNMIVVSALAAAVLLLLHGMDGKFWRHGAALAAGAAGFIVGFAPWLAWNARHGWASLEMSQIGGHAPLREALANSWSRFVMLQEARDALPGTAGPHLLALALLALAALGAGTAWARRRRAAPRANYAAAGAVLFCAIFAFVYATSGFTRTHTARYWIPLVPGLAVLAAVACAAPGARLRRAAAWLALGALVVRQGALAVEGIVAADRKAAATLRAYREVGAALERAGTDALLAPLQAFPLNFALGERFAVSNGKQKFYEPILRRAELSPAPAYSSDFNGVGVFLEQQGAAYDSIPAGGRGILWNVRRPAVGLREIPAERLAALRDGAGAERRPELSDDDLDTVWAPGSRAGATLEWTFAAPQDVYSLQLTFAHAMGAESFDFPRRIRVEARIAGAWQTLLADAPIVPLEWSGPRLYYPAGLARPEFRLDVRGAEALRATLVGEPRAVGVPWRLAEADVLEADGAPAPRDDALAVAELAAWLERGAPEAVVCAPRWISNRLLAAGAVPEERLAGLAERVFAAGPIPRDGTVAAEWPYVFVADARRAAAARAALAANRAVFREATVGDWRLFAVDAAGWTADGLGLPPAVQWTGEALLRGNAAGRVAAALRRLRAGGESAETERALLAEVVRWRPAALSALPEDRVRILGGEDAVQARRAFAQVPDAPCATVFANGVRLEGASVPAEVRAGAVLEVRLHWSCTADFAPGQESVFIHLRDARGKIVAQDDYCGVGQLWDEISLRPVPGECVAETRRIALPAGLPPGPLDLAIGLYQLDKGRRMPVASSAAPLVRRRAAVWPAAVHVWP